METLTSPVDIERMHSRVLNLGLLMNVFAPVVLIFVGVLVRTRGIDLGAVRDLGLFFWVLIAVALSEIPAIYFVKRTFLSRGKSFERGSENSNVEQTLFQMGVIIFSLSLAPTIYGLVYYLLGGSLERFVLFAAFTLFCFMVFKPKQEEISAIVKRHQDIGENPPES
ncbi:MAG: hypothetical protein JSV10_05745 [Candidatus Zixiibacteriota bacterium]|nr:MAG: hypothetical protein JSV10_05745 [candidate division Zixibacteria bacterium]